MRFKRAKYTIFHHVLERVYQVLIQINCKSFLFLSFLMCVLIREMTIRSSYTFIIIRRISYQKDPKGITCPYC